MRATFEMKKKILKDEEEKEKEEEDEKMHGVRDRERGKVKARKSFHN